MQLLKSQVTTYNLHNCYLANQICMKTQNINHMIVRGCTVFTCSPQRPLIFVRSEFIRWKLPMQSSNLWTMISSIENNALKVVGWQSQASNGTHMLATKKKTERYTHGSPSIHAYLHLSFRFRVRRQKKMYIAIGSKSKSMVISPPNQTHIFTATHIPKKSSCNICLIFLCAPSRYSAGVIHVQCPTIQNNNNGLI